jgi:hypothetical protein
LTVVLSSTPLPSVLSHCLPPAPSSSIIAPLPSMVGCCFLLVVPHPLRWPLSVSLLTAFSPTTCQQSLRCLAQFFCWTTLSGTTGNRTRAHWQRHHRWSRRCRQLTSARGRLPQRDNLRRRPSSPTWAPREG